MGDNRGSITVIDSWRTKPQNVRHLSIITLFPFSQSRIVLPLGGCRLSARSGAGGRRGGCLSGSTGRHSYRVVRRGRGRLRGAESFNLGLNNPRARTGHPRVFPAVYLDVVVIYSRMQFQILPRPRHASACPSRRRLVDASCRPLRPTKRISNQKSYKMARYFLVIRSIARRGC